MTKKTEQLIIDYVKKYCKIFYIYKPNSVLSYEKQPLTETDKKYGIIMRIREYMLVGKKDKTIVDGSKEELKAILHDYCVDTNLSVYKVDPDEDLTKLSIIMNKSRDEGYIELMDKLSDEGHIEWVNKTQKDKLDKEREKLLKIKEIVALRKKEKKQLYKKLGPIINKYQKED